MYSYRICQDDALVAKLIDPSYTPNQDDMTAMEDCFQVSNYITKRKMGLLVQLLMCQCFVDVGGNPQVL